MSISERRKGGVRIRFERPRTATIMAIDGTWCRECLLIDVSESGARISLTDGIAELTEFFLLLSAFGNPVFRRCKRQWTNGLEMGVAFHAAPASVKGLKELRRGAKLV